MARIIERCIVCGDEIDWSSGVRTSASAVHSDRGMEASHGRPLAPGTWHAEVVVRVLLARFGWGPWERWKVASAFRWVLTSSEHGDPW